MCGRRQRLLCLSGGTARLDANAREWRQKRKWAGDRHALMEAPRRPDRGEPLRCDIPRSICIFRGHLGTSALGLACAVAADPGPAARASGRGGVRGVDGARDRIVPGEEGAHQVVAERSEAAVGWQPAVAAYFAGAIGVDGGAIVGLGCRSRGGSSASTGAGPRRDRRDASACRGEAGAGTACVSDRGSRGDAAAGAGGVATTGTCADGDATARTCAGGDATAIGPGAVGLMMVGSRVVGLGVTACGPATGADGDGLAARIAGFGPASSACSSVRVTIYCVQSSALSAASLCSRL